MFSNRPPEQLRAIKEEGDGVTQSEPQGSDSMLRAFGVLFIVAACFVAGVLGLVATYFGIKYAEGDLTFGPPKADIVAVAPSVDPTSRLKAADLNASLDLAPTPQSLNPPGSAPFAPQQWQLVDPSVSPIEQVGFTTHSTLPLPFGFADTSIPAKVVRIKELGGAGLEWKAEQGEIPTTLFLSSGAKVEVELAPRDSNAKFATEAADITINDVKYSWNYNDTTKHLSATLDPATFTRPFRVRDRYTNLSPNVHLVVPNTAPPVSPPRIAAWSHSPYLPLTTATTGTLGPIYGGYLKVQIQSVSQSPTDHHFVAVFKDGATVMETREIRPLASEIAWVGGDILEATLKLEKNNAKTVDLYVVTDANGRAQGQHAYSSDAKTFSLTSVTVPSSQVALTLNVTKPSSGPDVVKLGEVTFVKDRSFELTLAAGSARAGVVLVPSGTNAPTPLDFSTEKPIPVTVDRDAEFTYSAKLYQGDTLIGNATPIKVHPLKEKPQIIEVNSTEFSALPEHSALQIFFSRDIPLKDTTVNTSDTVKGYFKLIGPYPTEGTLAATDVAFDSKSNSITVTFDNSKKIAPGQYKVQIGAGITDIVGNALDLTRSFTVIKGGTGGSPAIPTRGLSASTGEYVRMGEYTPPRPSIEGFNPSDKVVTRVARLYYFRDAHRVVQLINRKARSFNRSAISVQEQLADRSRLQADIGNDKRLELEAAAIQAAKAARQAEETLQQQQQALINTRAQQAQVQQQLGPVQAQLQERRIELDRVTAERSRGDAILKTENDRIATLTTSRGTYEKSLRDLEYEAKGDPTVKADEIRRAKFEISEIDLELTPLTQSRNSHNLQLAELSSKEQTLNERIRPLERTVASLQSQQLQATGFITQLENSVTQLLGEVQSQRAQEITKTEAWDRAEQQEKRLREEQFRREVAAAHEDPDTYVPGYPNSDDPVEQCSLSVIGEGLIQIRGPRKGVNIVHTMINQIDSPVGQVRVGIHTVQINGEHGDRMEKVAMRIQRYLDHSRFLTMQSGEMLRKAVVQVAARRAEQAVYSCPPGCPAEERDMKYREAFFGKDFIDELREMDSEFLKSENKVLSLHSMDTTSLASALFLMSLAKNDTRLEILNEFMGMVQGQLPIDEQEYFTASNAEYKFHHKNFQFLAQNAKFVSLRGFFDAQIEGPDTLTPMQREFIRLGQIFKAKLVTEIELRQRVMERSLIEERIGDFQKKQRELKQLEEGASAALLESRRSMQTKAFEVGQSVERIVAYVDGVRSRTNTISNEAARIEEDLNRVATQVAALAGFQGHLTQADLDNILNVLFPTTLDTTERDQHLNLSDRIKVLDDLREAAFEQKGSLDHFTKKELAEWKQRRIRASLLEKLREIRIQLNGKTFRLSIINEDVPSPEWKLELINTDGTVNKDGWAELHLILSDYHKVCSDASSELHQFNHQNNAAMAVALREADVLTNNVILTDNAESLRDLHRIMSALRRYRAVAMHVSATGTEIRNRFTRSREELVGVAVKPETWDVARNNWDSVRRDGMNLLDPAAPPRKEFGTQNASAWTQSLLMMSENVLDEFRGEIGKVQLAAANAENARRPLDHKKFLDMLIDDVEEKYIELVEGTRAQTANIDNYLMRLSTALEDDLNTQFYQPAFRLIRESSYTWDVQLGQIQTETILTNNRMFAKVSPQATMEFDLPKRQALINEAFEGALAAYDDYGALLGDPTFLAMVRMQGGHPSSATFGSGGPGPFVQNVLPGLPSQTDGSLLSQGQNNVPTIGSNLEALIPDPAVYKFETGTGFEIRPVIQPDGQAVVFHLNYMYTTNVREPVRADEKHLGRVKRHFIDTDVVTGNYELREVSRYQVGLKASRTSRGVPLLEDIPLAGVLFRPLPSKESALQQNLIYAQSVIYPTLYDLMGLRWAPAVSDLSSMSIQEREFVARNREKFLRNEVFDYSSLQVDDFMRIPESERRGDLYRTQESIPGHHPNGYDGRGLNLQRGQLREGYTPTGQMPAGDSAQFYTPQTSEGFHSPGQHGELDDVIEEYTPGTHMNQSSSYTPSYRTGSDLPTTYHAPSYQSSQSQQSAIRRTEDSAGRARVNGAGPVLPVPQGAIPVPSRQPVYTSEPPRLAPPTTAAPITRTSPSVHRGGIELTNWQTPANPQRTATARTSPTPSTTPPPSKPLPKFSPQPEQKPEPKPRRGFLHGIFSRERK
ncbi:MAG: hypothetical protein R3C01_12785 [Planctomycetaceae bacterium]